MTRPTATGARQARSLVRVSAVWTAFALVAACQEQLPIPRLYMVTPQKLHSDRPQRLRLAGSQLVPRYDLDLSSGSRHADANGFSGFVGDEPNAQVLRDFAFFGPGSLDATLDPGLAAGTYNVSVVDPRGARAVLSGGFISLGPDTTPPTLTILSPAAAAQLAPGTPVMARALIEDDGAVHDFAWTARGRRGPAQQGTCAAGSGSGSAPPGRMTCDFRFVVPDQLLAGEVFELLVTATDDAPRANRATLARSFLLQARPTLASIAPGAGSADGGTDVIVRGHGFGPGTRVLFGNVALEPDGGLLLDDGTVAGKTPPHAPGVTVVRVLTPLGDVREDGTFEYLAVPALLTVEPARALSTGGSPLRIRGQNFSAATRISFGKSLATAVGLAQASFIDPNEIRGVAPSGEGTVTVFAVDPQAGWAQLPAGFTWETSP